MEETQPLGKSTGLPRKRFYRARAHGNPRSDSHFLAPLTTRHVDYSPDYPHCSHLRMKLWTNTKDQMWKNSGEWMKSCLENHPRFEALTEEELEADPVAKLLSSATEGQKVARNGGQTFRAVYRPIASSISRGYFKHN